MLQKGKLNIGFIDASAGSSGKGKMNDFLANKAGDGLDFAITQNSQNASHIVCDDNGGSYKYNFLPSSTYTNIGNKNFKVVAGADAVVSLEQVLKEIKDHELTEENMFIHPNVTVITDDNIKWEEENLGYLASTMTGGGAAKGMKIMRAKGVVTADMIDELKPYIANTHLLVNKWLCEGQTGILETAQGFDLSLDNVFGYEKNPIKYFPKTTSRNINPMAFLGMSFVPHVHIGNVLMNFRTFPIRVGDSSNVNKDYDTIIKFKDGSEIPFKFDDKVFAISSKGEGLYVSIKELHDNPSNISNGGKISTDKDTYKDFSSFVELGSSGGCYPDQRELTWDDITKISGSDDNIIEKTSLTIRTRRVFSPSALQIQNTTMCCSPTHMSINFVNYLDNSIEGVSGEISLNQLKSKYPAVFNYVHWLHHNQFYLNNENAKAYTHYLGTGARRSEMLVIKDYKDIDFMSLSDNAKQW